MFFERHKNCRKVKRQQVILGKIRHIYLKVLCIIVLANIASASRLFASAVPCLSISYVGAGYAFQANDEAGDNHYVAADTDLDDDGEQLHHFSRSIGSIENPFTHWHATSARVLLIDNRIPFDKNPDSYSCLKPALPLRI